MHTRPGVVLGTLKVQPHKCLCRAARSQVVHWWDAETRESSRHNQPDAAGDYDLVLKHVFEVGGVGSSHHFCNQFTSLWLGLTSCMSVRLSLFGRQQAWRRETLVSVTVKAHMYGRRGSVWCLSFVEDNKLA